MDPEVEKMLNHEISTIRSTIIDHSVKVEFMINEILCRVLGLSSQLSVSFGPTSSALSFIAKVHLLLDLKILEKENKNKLKCFAEIRNQFAHNFLITDVNKCPEAILKQIRTWYSPKSRIDQIENFDDLYLRLFNDVKGAIETLLNVVIEKAGKKGEELGQFNFNKFLFEQVKEYSEQDSDFKNKFIALIHQAQSKFQDNPPSDEYVNNLPLL